jgi:hypothetical protein
MIERQHVWLGAEATSFDEPCEACLAVHCVVHGTLRVEADVGFTTCRRGHRIVVHRIVRPLARAV